MRVEQIITDYIPRSILTAQGQMVTRGPGIPEAIAQGGLNHYLKSKGAGANPVFEALEGVLNTIYRGRGAGNEPLFQAFRGDDDEYFVGQGAGNEPVWRPLQINVHYEAGITADHYVECGFRPRIVIIIGHTDYGNGSVSWGWCDHVNEDCVYMQGDTNAHIVSTNHAFYLYSDATHYINGDTFSSFPNGYTINVVDRVSPISCNLLLLAIG